MELIILRGGVEAGKVRNASALASVKKHLHEEAGLTDIGT